jgi:hypothetical protein
MGGVSDSTRDERGVGRRGVGRQIVARLRRGVSGTGSGSGWARRTAAPRRERARRWCEAARGPAWCRGSERGEAEHGGRGHGSERPAPCPPSGRGRGRDIIAKKARLHFFMCV